jgi:hypothetical protein
MERFYAVWKWDNKAKEREEKEKMLTRKHQKNKHSRCNFLPTGFLPFLQSHMSVEDLFLAFV